MTRSKFSRWVPKSLRGATGRSTGKPVRSRLSVTPLETREVPAGQLDGTFNGTGNNSLTTDFGFDDRAAAVLVRPDGRTVLVGSIDGGSADFAVAQYNLDGTLDTSFSSDGKNSITLGGHDFATAAALQADGKLVVVGYTDAATGNNDFAVVRFNADGSLDSTFDGDGKLLMNFGLDDRAQAVAIRADGKIVVAGSYDGGNSDFAVVRLNADGTPDTSFDGDGKQTINFFGADFATGVAFQADGKIVMGGYTNAGGANNDFALARLNSDGTLDGTFGTGGRATADSHGGDDKAMALLVQANDQIVLAGSGDPGQIDFVVARFHADGTPDATFGTNNSPGVQAHTLGNVDVATSIVPVAGGYVVAGYTNVGGDNNLAAIRIDSTGAVDATFGTAGVAKRDFGSDDRANGLAVRADGNIVLAGYTGAGASGSNTNNFALALFDANGQPANAGGGTGKVTTNFGATDTARGVLVQPDGKIVAVGSFDGGLGDFAVARYNPDGSLDKTFSGDGKTNFTFTPAAGTFGFQETATAAALQSDGKIVVVGYANKVNNGSNDFAVARLNADGSLDTTFGAAGTGLVTVDLVANGSSMSEEKANAVAIDPTTGRIVVAGTRWFSNTDADFAAIALDKNGNLDTTFGESNGVAFVAFDLFGGQNDGANAVAIQPDGKIVLGGYAESANGFDYALARLDASGNGDMTFGGKGTGKTTVDFGLDTPQDKINAILIRPNGRIFVAGGGDTSTFDFTTAQFLPDGTPDLSYGSVNGTGQASFTLGANDTATSAVLQPDGRVVLAGYSDANDVGKNNFAIIRLNPSGTLDNTFNGNTGKAVIDFGGNDKAFGVALQPDGRIVVAGIANGTDFALARLTGDPVASSLLGAREFAVGSDTGGSSASLYNPDGSKRYTVTPFPGFVGGIRTAAGDFNGDGTADLVVATGPGSATHVRILDGVSQAELYAVDPFEAAFTGGLFVAAGDINGDGKADLVITPDEGGGPRARVFRGGDFVQLADFFGIEDPNFRGGARAAVADVTGDGKADLLVAAGFGGGPRLAEWGGASVAAGTPAHDFGDFFVFEQTLRNGVYIAGGDINGDGFADVVAGGGPGGGPRVFALSGKDLTQSATQTQLANFFAGDPNSRGGVRLSVKNLNGDAKADLVVGAGANAGSQVNSYLGSAIAPNNNPAIGLVFDAFPGFLGGVFVG